MTSNKVLPDLSKLEPLDGTNYRWLSKKLLIFFKELEVDYVHTTYPIFDPITTTLAPYNPESFTKPSVIVVD